MKIKWKVQELWKMFANLENVHEFENMNIFLIFQTKIPNQNLKFMNIFKLCENFPIRVFFKKNTRNLSKICENKIFN